MQNTVNIRLGNLLSSTDPFESCLIEMVKVNRAKRGDYALDADPFSNFRQSAETLGLEGFGPIEAVIHLIGVKLARLRALRANKRDPNNESLLDTYTDLAVYSVICLALAREAALKAEHQVKLLEPVPAELKGAGLPVATPAEVTAAEETLKRHAPAESPRVYTGVSTPESKHDKDFRPPRFVVVGRSVGEVTRHIDADSFRVEINGDLVVIGRDRFERPSPIARYRPGYWTNVTLFESVQAEEAEEADEEAW